MRTEQKLITGDVLRDFEDKVNDHIAEGWEIKFPVSVAIGAAYNDFHHSTMSRTALAVVLERKVLTP